MSKKLTLATYNINSIKSRLDLLLRWLEKTEIDILCLQELKQEEKAFPYIPLENLGYRSYVFAEKRYNGVAICSRLPLHNIQYGFGCPSFDGQKRMISAQYKDLHIINLYVPHGDVRGSEKYRFKMDFLSHLVHYLTRFYSDRDRICLLGDLNIAHRDVDVWDPQLLRDDIGTMPEEREFFARLLQFGFIDAFRHHYADSRQFTWWNYIGGAVWKNQGMRIDYILVTSPLLDKVTDITIDMWPRRRRSPTPSDHAPVIMEILLD